MESFNKIKDSYSKIPKTKNIKEAIISLKQKKIIVLTALVTILGVVIRNTDSSTLFIRKTFVNSLGVAIGGFLHAILWTNEIRDLRIEKINYPRACESKVLLVHGSGKIFQGCTLEGTRARMHNGDTNTWNQYNINLPKMFFVLMIVLNCLCVLIFVCLAIIAYNSF